MFVVPPLIIYVIIIIICMSLFEIRKNDRRTKSVKIWIYGLKFIFKFNKMNNFEL